KYEYVTINGEALSDQKSFFQIKSLQIVDSLLGQKITISLDTPFDLHYFGLKTLSQSEEGFDLSLQGIGFAMVVPFTKQLFLQGTLECSDV
ncbi:MAG: DUF1926 domain-containing protein, partial [Campylobacterales bacterium]|nr:DUF1926 domain-containing protein [Campylobacterales bacterium]